LPAVEEDDSRAHVVNARLTQRGPHRQIAAQGGLRSEEAGTARELIGLDHCPAAQTVVQLRAVCVDSHFGFDSLPSNHPSTATGALFNRQTLTLYGDGRSVRDCLALVDASTYDGRTSVRYWAQPKSESLATVSSTDELQTLPHLDRRALNLAGVALVEGKPGTQYLCAR
jgi:hypothetical protein